jgi:hypothetical protein
MPSKPTPILPARIDSSIRLIRGQRVILDTDIAALYQVPLKQLNQAVRRNRNRFPGDFMFLLTAEEFESVSADPTGTSLRSQFVTSNKSDLRSQIVTSKKGRGGRRSLPYAFTEQGVAMLSSVLRSRRAVAVNIEIMRAFVRLRHMLSTHAELARKVDELEKKYDKRFSVVFDALRALMEPPPEPKKPRIGFHAESRA